MGNFLKSKSILVTGGTGSFGKAFVKRILDEYKSIRKIVVYSRDELKQTEMSKSLKKEDFQKTRFFIGDVRDKSRLNRALDDIDIVVHAAALKHVPVSEYNPTEFIKTNIIGAQNIIDVCLDKKVENVIALSTDKAASPINLYGATKLASDKLFISSNNIKGSKKIKFSVVRYGNVFGSRGSVVPMFLNLKKNEPTPITDINMTRFNISLEHAVDFVIWSIKNNLGGEIFVPKLSSYKIVDLAEAIRPKSKFKIVGVRPGEKIFEELISKFDSLNTFNLKNCYTIIDPNNEILLKKYNKSKYKRVKNFFEYNSTNNESFLNRSKLVKLVTLYKNNMSIK
tara:strand:- start:1203 stop:2219 length:1017 start_codon:yes stop_codon:yes gene_type:complete